MTLLIAVVAKLGNKVGTARNEEWQHGLRELERLSLLSLRPETETPLFHRSVVCGPRPVEGPSDWSRRIM